MQPADTLARLFGPASDNVRMRTATIAASTATSCTLNLAGGTVSGVPYLTTYTPVVGHTVVVLQTTAGLLVVIGRTA